MLVRIDRTPARTEAEATAVQLTSDINAAVPMVAMAVCATVRTARLSAAIQNSLLFMLSVLFLSNNIVNALVR